jgi:hypothetical protein
MMRYAGILFLGVAFSIVLAHSIIPHHHHLIADLIEHHHHDEAEPEESTDGSGSDLFHHAYIGEHETYTNSSIVYTFLPSFIAGLALNTFEFEIFKIPPLPSFANQLFQYDTPFLTRSLSFRGPPIAIAL